MKRVDELTEKDVNNLKKIINKEGYCGGVWCWVCPIRRGDGPSCNRFANLILAKDLLHQYSEYCRIDSILLENE